MSKIEFILGRRIAIRDDPAPESRYDIVTSLVYSHSLTTAAVVKLLSKGINECYEYQNGNNNKRQSDCNQLCVILAFKYMPSLHKD
jgi:hypothetical protein